MVLDMTDSHAGGALVDDMNSLIFTAAQDKASMPSRATRWAPT
jgi:hypothetical protein